MLTVLKGEQTVCGCGLTSIRDLADLQTVHENLSLASLCFCEVDDVLGIQEVDKGIANVASVSKVDSQVHEVESTLDREVQDLLELSLGHLVWDVSDHDL